MILEVNNIKYSGFESSPVMLSMGTLANKFTIVAVNKWINSDNPIKADSECSLWHPDGTELVRGYITQVIPTIDGRITITGFDKSVDLVECTVDGTGQFTNLTPKEIITAICNPFGITVTGETGTRIPQFGYNKDDMALGVIREVITRQGLLCNSDGIGGLIIGGVTDSEKADIVLQEGVNILRNSFAVLNSSKLHSSYTALGQSWASNTSASTFEGLANRYRPLTFINSGSNEIQDCDTSARWKAQVNDGSAQHYNVSTYDLQAVKPNQLIDINAPSLGVSNQQLLITDVEFIPHKAGSITRMILAPPYKFGGSTVENTFM